AANLSRRGVLGSRLTRVTTVGRGGPVTAVVRPRADDTTRECTCSCGARASPGRRSTVSSSSSTRPDPSTSRRTSPVPGWPSCSPRTAPSRSSPTRSSPSTGSDARPLRRTRRPSSTTSGRRGCCGDLARGGPVSDEDGELLDPLDLQIESRNQRRSVGRLWQLVRRSTRLVWAAGRMLFVGLLVVQVVAALVLAGQVVVVESFLASILDLGPGDGVPSGLVLTTLALAGLMALASVLDAVRGKLSRYLGESVARRTYQDVLDAATGVSLRHFESSTFYARLQRVEAAATSRPFHVTQALLGIVGGLTATLGVGAVLVGIHPVLLPLLLVGGLPMILTNRRESRLEFRFTVDQTPPQGQRFYLSYLLTTRDEAKEIRAFDLGQPLRS